MKATSTLQVFREFLKRERGLRFSDFEALHRWSVEDQSAFWEAVWRFDGFDSPTRYSSVLANANMPGASWFPGAQVNYARQIFRHVELAEAAGQPAVIAEDERGPVETVGWSELQRRAASMALELRRLGVARGDRDR